ncbi:MAG TPA: glycosyltransferase family 1 protein [Opitutaceae bacterium]|nr:glycosyltransferase family 1 protein [Opitutaceae bacterium]
MILLDLSHTSHTRARTGVQRVCRSVCDALAAKHEVQAITFDPYQAAWRPLAAWERANLASADVAAKRGAQWPLGKKIIGRLRRIRGGTTLPSGPIEALIVPEIFSETVARNFPALFQRVRGPRIAIFHDAIALKLPELTPGKTVARFPAYLQEMLAFDGIAAVSEDSLQSLREYWDWLGVSKPPILTKISLGLTPPHSRLAFHQASHLHKLIPVLCVGSIEGRKNHLALLDACEKLWHSGLEFELRLVGLAHAETGRAALHKIKELQAAHRPLRYDGAVSEADLENAYAECAFTVYPSLMEGFGLPVLESVHRGRACICSNKGALGEAARGGGCLTLDSVDADSLAAAIERLVNQPAERDRLAREALARPVRTWTQYAQDLNAFIVDVAAATNR